MLKHIKIGTKLITSFIIISILASISGLVGLVISMSIDKNYSKALVENGFVQGNIGNFNTYLNKDGAVVRDIVFLADAAELSGSQQELNSVKEKTTEELAKLIELCKTPAEVEQLKIIQDTYPLYNSSRDKVAELGLANKNDEALQLFRTEARPYLNTCMDAAQKLMDINYNLGNQVSVDLTTQTSSSIFLIIFIILVTLVLSILLGIIVSRSISKPIVACSDRLKLLAEGDLHSPVPETDATDEAGTMLTCMKVTTTAIQLIIEDIDRGLGELADGNLNINSTADFKGDYIEIKKSIDKIITSLNDTLSQINVSSEQVSSGSDQVSIGAQALSQGATEQASSVEELAATINDISRHIQVNAESAKEANAKMNSVSEEVGQCNGQMQDMTAAMSDISHKSNEIGKIIKTIEDIAFQTNILALNAAVEAARAGSAGKGFAVVADEVRNLASKSADAAKDTTALIESTITAVSKGTLLSDATAETLKTVVGSTRLVTNSINGIAASSAEQADAISQVTMGVDQISAVVQTNSATAEESAAASEELTGQATLLKELVGRFRLKNSDLALPLDSYQRPANENYVTSHHTATHRPSSTDKY